MIRKRGYKFFTCILFTTVFFINAYTATPSWQLVAGGDPIAQPINTEYGFAMLLDGRTLAAVSSNGTLLWNSGIPAGKPSDFIGLGDGGFLFTVSGNNKLSMFNPSGLCLWTQTAPDKIITAPIQGRDGRIFVQCQEKVACYSVKGSLKWSVEVGTAAGFPLLQLEDGSILHVQSKTIGGCSTALRFSPFGEVLEEITFTGKVSNITQTAYGVLILFADGSAGCCSASSTGAITRWVVPSELIGSGKSAKLVSSKDGKTAVIFSPSSNGKTSLVFMNAEDGGVLSHQSANVDGNTITYSTMEGNNFVICSTKTAGCYSVADGIIWEATIPSQKRWSYLLYTDNGYLVVFEKNSWVTSAYRMTQKIGYKPTKSSNTKNSNYIDFTNQAAKENGLSSNTAALFGKTIPQTLFEQIQKELPKGDYGEQEALWIAALELENKQITNRLYMTNNQFMDIFKNNISYFQQVLLLCPMLESSTFNKTIALIIQNETDLSMLVTAIQAAAKIGYDPDATIITSIQQLLRRQSLISNGRISGAICDAVYEICRFMGKPTLFTQGRQILSHMLNQSIDAKAKAYAAITMEKIIALQM
ncbi:MAG: hypothetical protein J6B81_02655 [Spirochaetaceae bacterium]|nr:hypothetical protein [Spirochaetaceae bacterium]